MVLALNAYMTKMMTTKRRAIAILKKTVKHKKVTMPKRNQTEIKSYIIDHFDCSE